MKKLLSAAVAAVSIAAMADINYSPTIGVTQITTTNKNTIVAVPFTSLAGDTAISVKDLVCTNGIDVGSWIYVFKDNSYKAWQLADTGWAAATTAVEGDSGYSIPATGDENVASPGAIWVILKDAPQAGTPKSIYIYGNYTNQATQVTVAAGNNLIANPLQSDANITIATSEAQIPVLRNQLGDNIDISVEPCRKDTFPAIVLSCLYLKFVKKLSDDSKIIVLPVDPYVKDDYFIAIKNKL